MANAFAEQNAQTRSSRPGAGNGQGMLGWCPCTALRDRSTARAPLPRCYACAQHQPGAGSPARSSTFEGMGLRVHQIKGTLSTPIDSTTPVPMLQLSAGPGLPSPCQDPSFSSSSRAATTGHCQELPGSGTLRSAFAPLGFGHSRFQGQPVAQQALYSQGLRGAPVRQPQAP